ncbi:hypothetical protein [Nonomuraea typhae]|uniref:Uncharacterized protein n=1 Tax=Nonomuraea typhae TaxID=2603600 RepID=A0ABW7YZB9_9ACTN
MATIALALACVMGGASAVAAAPAAAAAKPNLRSCYDGKCQFTFTKPVKFRVAKKYGIGWLRVSRVWYSDTGTGMVSVVDPGGSVSMGEGGRGYIGSLNFRVISITARAATIRFTG